MIRRLAIVSISAFLMTGCASSVFSGKSGSGYKMKRPDPVAERLIEASNDAAKSVKVLARVNNAKAMKGLSPQQMKQDSWQNENAPVELTQRVDVDRWSGPPDTIVSNLTAYVGWNFSVAGKSPVPTPIVSLRGENKRVIDYLYDIGYQLGDRADIVITPSTTGKGGMIKLLYKTKKNQTSNTWHGN